MHFGPMVYLKFDAGQFWGFLLRKSTKNFREIDLVGAGGGCFVGKIVVRAGVTPFSGD